jgi:uncharacterized protein
MLVILPPSETKVSGGVPGSTLDVSSLSFPVLRDVREALITELIELSGDESASLKALKLGPKGLPEVARNQALLTSPTMPALSRYTGVLYDAVDYASFPPDAATRADQSLAVFSALFGLVRAYDQIPAYRLSWDSALAGGKPGKRFEPLASALWESVPGFVLDVRSEGYRSLAPVPPDKGVYVSLVTPGPGGTRVAIGHHNKGVKGRLVRQIMLSGAVLASLDDFVAWGGAHGYHVDADSFTDGTVELVIDL